MRFIRTIVMLLAASLLLHSCNRALERSLEAIECYVQECPDSALAVLEGMDTLTLSTDRSRAMYAYLTSFAKYKLCINEDSVDGIAFAEEWFSRHHDKYRRMRALYLKGYTQYILQDYNHAVASLTEGERRAEELGDLFFAGLCCRELAGIFELSYSYLDYYQYSKKAYDFFAASRHDVHATFELLHVGKGLSELGRIEEIDGFYSGLLETGRQRKDTLFLALVCRDYASALLLKPDPCISQIIDLFSEAYSTYHYNLEGSYWADWGYAWARCGEKDNAEACFSVAESYASTPFEKYFADYRKYNGMVALGQKEAALEAMQRALKQLNGVLSDSREKALISQRDYYQQEDWILRLERRLFKQTTWVAIVISVLLVGLLILCVLFYRIRSEKLREEKEALVYQIHLLSKTQSDKLKLSAKTGMRVLDSLAQLNWQRQDEKIPSTLNQILSDFAANREVQSQLISVVNETRNNLMTRLADQVPSLNARELMLYCYLANGIGHNTICNILNKNASSLNAQSYRMRSKIAHSGAKDSAEFLETIQ